MGLKTKLVFRLSYHEYYIKSAIKKMLSLFNEENPCQSEETYEVMRQENEMLRGQLNSMCAANVHLILKDNEKKKMEEKDRVICEKDEKIGMLQDKVRGITREHVKYILSNAQLAALSEELTSENKKMKQALVEQKESNQQEVIELEVEMVEERTAEKEREIKEEKEKLERVFREKEEDMVKEREGKLGRLREELRRL